MIKQINYALARKKSLFRLTPGLTISALYFAQRIVSMKKAYFVSQRSLHLSTVCIRDLDKLKFIWWFHFRHKIVFATGPVVSKILLTIKVVKCDPKIITSLRLPKLNLNP